MKYFSVGRLPHGLLIACSCLLITAPMQAGAADAAISRNAPGPSCQAASDRPVLAFPSGNLSCGRQLNFIGVYEADGIFRPMPFHPDAKVPGARSGSNVGTLRPAEVPPSIPLDPVERVVQDFGPGHHAVSRVKGQTRISTLVDRLVTFAYGRELALSKPVHITTDSRARLIIADPTAGAVHILDQEKSFRIATGPNHRIATPAAVAVDGEDNIYIADPRNALVLVYDSQGRFLRYIGKLDDETIFESPAAVAIDRSNRRLYVTDTTRDRVFILDLQGHILDRIGSRNSENAVILNRPTEIVVNNGLIAVLDTYGSRVVVLDRNGKLISSFEIALKDHLNRYQRGISLDRQGNVYVSNIVDSSVRVFSSQGALLAAFGQSGPGSGQFNAPGGLWIDTANRIYVADTGNRRVQVFQLKESESIRSAGLVNIVAPSK